MWKCYAEDLALGKSRRENKTLIFLLAQQFRNMTYGSGREYTPYHVIPSEVVSLKYDERAALPVSFTSGCYGHPSHAEKKGKRHQREIKQTDDARNKSQRPRIRSFPCLERCRSSVVILSQAHLLHKGKNSIKGNIGA